MAVNFAACGGIRRCMVAYGGMGCGVLDYWVCFFFVLEDFFFFFLGDKFVLEELNDRNIERRFEIFICIGLCEKTTVIGFFGQTG